MLVLAIVASTGSAYAKLWARWNAAPYAVSQEAACRKAPTAIDGFSFPEQVKAYFKKTLGTTCKGGMKAWITPDMLLEQMWSGESGKKPPHVMNNVTVAELPVLKSPDRRKYRKGSVAESAKALRWEFAHEGKTYMLYLPFVCFNWTWGFGSPPPPRPVPPPPLVIQPLPTVPPPAPPILELCAEVGYTVEPGDEVRFAVLAQRRLPSSGCWRLCDGDDCAAPPSPCDFCDWIGPKSVIPDGFEPLHTGRYVAKSAKQTLRFPREIMTNYVALCVTREGWGESNSWVVQPSAWVGKTRIVVPYGGEQWPVWGDETIWSGWQQRPD